MGISRRTLLKNLAVAGAALTTPQIVWAKQENSRSPKRQGKPAFVPPAHARRPNIIFIMADQLPAACVGCYGSGVNSTPTLDRLAQRGVRFTRNFAHAPACAPNRASIFTGRSIEIHGITTNNQRLLTDNPLFTQVLQTYGYRTGGFGKFHFVPMPQIPFEDMAPFGFDESVMTEDPKFGAWLEWIKTEHPEYYEQALALCWPQPYMRAYGKDRVDIEPAWRKAREKYLAPLKKASKWEAMFPSPLPKELQQTVFITDRSLDFMRRHSAQHPDQPYCCYISYVAPHDPYDPPKPYDTMFNPKDMKPAVPMVGDHYSCKILESHRDVYGVRNIADKPEIVNQWRAYYHGNIRLIDDQIARVVKHLEETGQMDNTIIVFTTDHGEMLGDHGLITKWAMHYDKSIRTPLIVCGAGIKPEVVSDRLTSSLDIYPTILDWVSVDPRPPLEGKSFAGTCHGDKADRGWSELTVQLGPVRSIVTDDDWRLTIYDQEGEGQMFNLREDPDEQRNLYHDEAWTKKRLALHELFSRAYIRPYLTLVYRNLPTKDGHRCLVDDTWTTFTPLPW